MDIYDPSGKKYDGSDNAAIKQYASDMKDPKKKIVKQTRLKNGMLVSTVWLGINHNFGAGVPLIYETMVFDDFDTFNEVDVVRYSTREEARKGHTKMTHKYAHKHLKKQGKDKNVVFIKK